jgi:hypothetical protein
MSEHQKQKAEDQEVDGSAGREPTEGKWVAEPREPDPKTEGDGIARLSSDKTDNSVNPQRRQKGPDDEDVEEKVIEAGVEDNKIQMETEVELMPHKVPGT